MFPLPVPPRPRPLAATAERTHILVMLETAGRAIEVANQMMHYCVVNCVKYQHYLVNSPTECRFKTSVLLYIIL